MTNFFAKNTSPAYRELVDKGRVWHTECLTKLAGGGAHITSEPVELTDVVDGVVFDRYTIHISRPIEVEKRRVLDAIARAVQANERVVVVDIDQARYDRRWIATTWTEQQRTVGCVALCFCVVVLFFAGLIEYYRTTQLHGDPLLVQLHRIIDSVGNRTEHVHE